MKLLEKWPTPLASGIRYQSQACTVDGLSEEVSALPLADLNAAESLLDPDEIAFTDLLKDVEADPPTNEDTLGDNEDQSPAHSINFIWELPFVSSLCLFIHT